MEQQKNNFEPNLKFLRENLSANPFALKECFIKLVHNVKIVNNKIDSLYKLNKPEEEDNSETQMLYDNIIVDRNNIIKHSKEIMLLKQNQEELKDIMKKVLERLKEVEEIKPNNITDEEIDDSYLDEDDKKLTDFIANNKEFTIYEIKEATNLDYEKIRNRLKRNDGVRIKGKKKVVNGSGSPRTLYERIDVDWTNSYYITEAYLLEKRLWFDFH